MLYNTELKVSHNSADIRSAAKLLPQDILAVDKDISDWLIVNQGTLQSKHKIKSDNSGLPLDQV